MKKHLFLTGFMGAGKTSVGRPLANAMHLPFLDLDQIIVETSGRQIPEIFKTDGEAFFRDLETDCLLQLTAADPAVISTGGGIIGRSENRNFMHANGTVVYLSAEWETLRQRIGDPASRPLARSDDGWMTTQRLWLERCPLYEQADLIIKTDNRTIPEIISEIIRYAE